MKHLRSAKHRALIAAIVEARKAAGFTQRQLEAKLGRTGGFVWKIEAGERRCDVLDFMELAEILKIDPADLMQRVTDFLSKARRGAK